MFRGSLVPRPVRAIRVIRGCLEPSAIARGLNLHRRKMSTHALQTMARDLFRAMSLAPRQKCPRNVVEMKEATAAFWAVTALQFLATVSDQKLFWSKF